MACWRAISLKRVKMDEKFERYHPRPHTASPSPRLGVRNPNQKLQSLLSQERVKLRTSNLSDHSWGSSKRKPIKNLGEKGTWAYPGTSQTFLSTPAPPSSRACRRRSRCHEFPPCQSVLSTPLRRRQSEVHWFIGSLVVHRSQSGLSGTINPPSPIIRRTQNASLQSTVMVLWGVGVVQMAKEGQTTTAANSVGQKWLPCTRAYLESAQGMLL